MGSSVRGKGAMLTKGGKRRVKWTYLLNRRGSLDTLRGGKSLLDSPEGGANLPLI